MDAVYFNKDNIDKLNKDEVFERFKDYWGISKICDSSVVFLRGGKRYRFDHYHTSPCVLMKCIDDGSVFSFGVDSDIKNEFIKE